MAVAAIAQVQAGTGQLKLSARGQIAARSGAAVGGELHPEDRPRGPGVKAKAGDPFRLRWTARAAVGSARAEVAAHGRERGAAEGNGQRD